MSLAETPQACHTSPDAIQALAGRQLAVLERLAEAGLGLAVGLERQAGEAAADAAGLALAYARVSRAVRLTLALQTKLLGEAAELGKAEAARAEEARKAASRAASDDRQRRRYRLDRVLRRVIASEHDDEDAIERLTDEAWERLDDEDVCGELLQRPFAEIVGFICRDLGLSPDWARLEGEAWVRECGLDAPPQSAWRPAPPHAGERKPVDASPSSPSPQGGEGGLAAAPAGGP